MGKVAYSAVDKNKKTVTGYIEAANNEDAIKKLQSMELYAIELHGDVVFSKMRDDLEELSQDELDRIAQFERKSQANPSMLTSFLHFLKTYKIALIIGSLMIVWGIYNDSMWSWIPGAIIVSSIIVPWLYGYRDIWTFEEIQRLMAFGEYDQALQLIDAMRKRMKGKQKIVFQLDKFEANILACRGNTLEAIKLLEPHKEFLAEMIPGMYENSMASIYYDAGEYDLFLEHMQKMYDCDPQSSFALDLAFAEARFGDIDRAKDLIENDVNLLAVPAYVQGVYDWTLGLIAQTEGDMNKAKKHYENMLDMFGPYMHNPLVWVMLAVATGTYANMLYDMGQKHKGEKLLQAGTVKILNVHADDLLRKDLSKKYPELIEKETYCLNFKGQNTNHN